MIESYQELWVVHVLVKTESGASVSDLRVLHGLHTITIVHTIHFHSQTVHLPNQYLILIRKKGQKVNRACPLRQDSNR